MQVKIKSLLARLVVKVDLIGNKESNRMPRRRKRNLARTGGPRACMSAQDWSWPRRTSRQRKNTWIRHKCFTISGNQTRRSQTSKRLFWCTRTRKSNKITYNRSLTTHSTRSKRRGISLSVERHVHWLEETLERMKDWHPQVTPLSQIHLGTLYSTRKP